MKKRLYTLLILVIAMMMAMPAAVYATTPPPANAVRGTMTVEYRFMEGQTPSIPQEITSFGFRYYLVSQSAPVLESSLPFARTYSFTLNGKMTQEQLDDFVKTMNLGGATVKIDPEWITLQMEIDVEVKETLLLNDVEDLASPATVFDQNSMEFQEYVKQYIIDSKLVPGVTAFADIDNIVVEQGDNAPSITGVEFEPYDYDDGIPGGYDATSVYRGLVSFDVLGFNRIDVTYNSGDNDEVDVYIIFAEYESDELPPPVTVVDITEEPVPQGPGGLTPEEEDQIENQTGNIGTDIVDGNVPLGNTEVTGVWSFLSLIFSVAAIVIAVIFGIGFIARKSRANMLRSLGAHDEKELALIIRRGNLLRMLTIILGAITLVTWLLLDTFGNGYVWINATTPIVGILCALTIALCAITNARNKILLSGDEEPETPETRSTVA